MAIRKIRITNFKSFKDLEVELGDLNILIGANASGKSNFVDILRFLRDIEDSGLDNAISMQGGVEYLRNIKIGSSEVFSLEVILGPRSALEAEVEKKPTDIGIYETIYKFAIQFNEGELGFKITEDKLTHKLKLVRMERQKNEAEGIERIDEGEIIFSNVEGKVEFCPRLPDGVLAGQFGLLLELLESLSEGVGIPRKALLLEHPFISLFISLSSSSLVPGFQSSLEKDFGDISIYDFDPKRPKRFAPITGRAELEEDGANLALVLKNIIGKEDERRKFFNLLTYILPFVDDLDVERTIGKSFLFKLRETYSEQFLPAFSISDGTINIIALVIALYFEENPLAIIEEPGRNVHPYLVSKVIDMMEDASENKQIIVTTHNPEMVRYADKKDVLLISRDEEGFSSICRPSEKEDVKVFLEHGLKMERLYVDNFLEV